MNDSSGLCPGELGGGGGARGGSQMDGVRGRVGVPFLHWMPVGLDAR